MLFTEIYKDLASIDCSGFTEKKKDLTYLSWSHAWNAVASRYDSSYEVVRFDGKPYFFDESLGYYVETEVTIGGNIRKMQLFVMDGANNAMTNKEYTYEVDEWVYGKKTGKKIEKTVGKATMFEINTAIMRCLTKNLAIFGLGINIYAGEDLPLIDDEGNTVEKKIDTSTGEKKTWKVPEGQKELKEYIDEIKQELDTNHISALFIEASKIYTSEKQIAWLKKEARERTDYLNNGGNIISEPEGDPQWGRG